MPFIDMDRLEEREPLPGFKIRRVHSDNMTCALTKIKAGAASPVETHPGEHIMIVAEGQVELTIGEETRTLGPGDTAVVPSNVPHALRAITDCLKIGMTHPRSGKAEAEIARYSS